MCDSVLREYICVGLCDSFLAVVHICLERGTGVGRHRCTKRSGERGETPLARPAGRLGMSWPARRLRSAGARRVEVGTNGQTPRALRAPATAYCSDQPGHIFLGAAGSAANADARPRRGLEPGTCGFVDRKPNFTVSSTAYSVRATSLLQSNAVQCRGMQNCAATFSYTPRKRPGSHPKSPAYGHFKIPHLSAGS